MRFLSVSNRTLGIDHSPWNNPVASSTEGRTACGGVSLERGPNRATSGDAPPCGLRLACPRPPRERGFRCRPAAVKRPESGAVAAYGRWIVRIDGVRSCLLPWSHAACCLSALRQGGGTRSMLTTSVLGTSTRAPTPTAATDRHLAQSIDHSEFHILTLAHELTRRKSTTGPR